MRNVYIKRDMWAVASSLCTICDYPRTVISMALTTYRHGTVLVAKGHWAVVIVIGAFVQVLFDFAWRTAVSREAGLQALRE